MKKVLAFLLAAAMSVGVMAGCGDSAAPTGSTDPASTGGSTGTASDAGDADTGGKATEFTIACQVGGDVNPDINEWWLWEKYEEQTGIHVNWRFIEPTAVAEQKNLIMVSDDMPDAFWTILYTPDEMISYGSAGKFVNLAPYIDTCLPNMKKMLETVNGGLDSIKMPDGAIYSMIEFMDDYPQITCRYEINKKWLDAANLAVPTTIDELSAAFAAFKANDVNGNGDPNDEWPIYLPTNMIGQLEQLLCGSYGVGNNGLQPINQKYYLDASGTPQFLYTSDGIKQIWQLFADWWSKGYMNPDTFGTVDYEKWVTAGMNQQVGLFTWVNAGYLYTNAYQDYAAISVLQGPDSSVKPVMSWTDYPVRDNGSFCITSACKDPEALMKWADYFYTDEGMNFSWFGKEGETYNLNAEGKPVYIDDINNYAQGPQLGAFQYGLLVYGSFPTRFPLSQDVEIARGQDKEGAVGERLSVFAEDCDTYCPKELMFAMNSTPEEGAALSAMMADLDTYIKESRMKFTTGAWNFDSDWDAFVTQINKMGAEELIQIRRTQYSRSKGNG